MILARARDRILGHFLELLAEGNPLAWAGLIAGLIVAAIVLGVTALQAKRRRATLERLQRERMDRPPAERRAGAPKPAGAGEPAPLSARQEELRRKAPRARKRRFDWDDE